MKKWGFESFTNTSCEAVIDAEENVEDDGQVAHELLHIFTRLQINDCTTISYDKQWSKKGVLYCMCFLVHEELLIESN